MTTYWEITWVYQGGSEIPNTIVDSTDTSITVTDGFIVMYSSRSGVTWHYPAHTIEHMRSWQTNGTPEPEPEPEPDKPPDPIVIPPPKDPLTRAKMVG